MATDNTPPRLRLIVTIATIVVISLASFDLVFKSYFAFMTDEAKHEKLAPKTELLAQLVAEHDSLAGAKVPVDLAMSQVAKGTRPEIIEARPSEDMAPMTGWAKMPKQPPLPAPGAGLPIPTGAHTTAVMPAVDAGAAPTTTPDAGAPKGPAVVKDAGARAPNH
jgi:hypothetical protein